MSLPILPTIQEVADALGSPLEEWPGKCYGIACAIVDAELIKGEVRYGLYWGPIAETSMFAGKPCARHGWIEMDEGIIVDPTRWVFESAEPYIAVIGPDDPRHDQYDFGAVRLRAAFDTGPPAFNSEEEAFTLAELGWAGTPTEVLAEACLGCSPPWSMNQIYWLANRPPQQLVGCAAAIYQGIVDVGGESWIPIDFRDAVFGRKKRKRKAGRQKDRRVGRGSATTVR